MATLGNVTEACKDWGSKSIEFLKQAIRPTRGKTCMLFGFYCGMLLCAILSATLPPKEHGLIVLFAFIFPLMLFIWLLAYGEDVIGDWIDP